jgi:hypothetical protein
MGQGGVFDLAALLREPQLSTPHSYCITRHRDCPEIQTPSQRLTFPEEDESMRLAAITIYSFIPAVTAGLGCIQPNRMITTSRQGELSPKLPANIARLHRPGLTLSTEAKGMVRRQRP